MRAQPEVKSTARVQLVVESQQLRARIAGGDREFSAASPLELDGSASVDPNGGVLAYNWTVARASNSAEVALPGGVLTDGRRLALPAAALAADTAYNFTLTISSASVAETASASVVVDALAKRVPSITFGALSKDKYAAAWSLSSQRIALTTSLDATAAALGAGAFTYAWAAYTLVNNVRTPAELRLDDATAVTTTGATRPDLVFRSGVLLPGATYAFVLTVSPTTGVNYVAARASQTVVVNSPPFGGGLTVDPPTGGVAITTPFALSAPGCAAPRASRVAPASSSEQQRRPAPAFTRQ